jgi:hypothetical protein
VNPDAGEGAPQRNQQIAPDTLEKFFENQRKELDVKGTEQALKRQEDEHAFRHAQKMLDAQERDRANQRTFRLSEAKHRYCFVGGLVLVALVFFGSLALMGKDQMALEFFKATTYLATGAIGGYFYGRSRPHGQQLARESGVEDIAD